MSDLELTEKVAKWCGLKHERKCGWRDNFWEENVYYKPEGTYECIFDPLNDWNDVMKIVVQRLPSFFRVEEQSGHYQIKDYRDVNPVIKEGPLPDLNRAVVTLIAELWDNEN